MDELELLARTRPDPEPASDVVVSHRAQLHRAIGQTASTNGAAREPAEVIDLATAAPPRSRRRLVAGIAAAALLVAAGATLVATGRDGDQVVTADDADPTATTAPTTASPLGCGASLPFALPVPGGFEGPVAGTSVDAPTAARADQLVHRWTGPGGSIELRWPADVDPYRGAVRDNTGAAAVSTMITQEPLPLPTGRTAWEVVVTSLGVGTGECQSIQLLYAGDDSAAAAQLASQATRLLFEPGAPFGGPLVPLVTGVTAAAAAPGIPPCRAPAGVPHNDYVGGPVSAGTFPTPAEALAAFIATQVITDVDSFGVEVLRATIAERGYVETHLPDGTVAFVHEVGAGRTVVYAVTTADGWTVDRWDATGC